MRSRSFLFLFIFFTGAAFSADFSWTPSSKPASEEATSVMDVPAVGHQPSSAGHAPEETPASDALATEESTVSERDDQLQEEAPEEFYMDYGYGFPDHVAIHGFVTQSAFITSQNEFYGHTSNGSFEFFEAVLNFTTDISDDLWVGVQVVGEKLGPHRMNTLTVDWAFGDYHFCDLLGLRIGKVKVPFGIWGQVVDVGPARPFIVLPQGIYRFSFRNFVVSVLGISAYGTYETPCWGTFNYEVGFGGNDFCACDSIFQEFFIRFQETLHTTDFAQATISNFTGKVFVEWETPCQGLDLYLSLSRHMLDIDSYFPNPLGPGTGSLFVKPIRLDRAALSARYEWKDFTIFAEAYAHKFERHRFLRSGPALATTKTYLNSIAHDLNIAVEYRGCDPFVIAAYYDWYIHDKVLRDDPDNFQKDLCLAMVYNFTPNFLMKLEGHYVRGYALLLDQDNMDGYSTQWWMGAASASFVF